MDRYTDTPNLRLTFDGETGKLKTAVKPLPGMKFIGRGKGTKMVPKRK